MDHDLVRTMHRRARRKRVHKLCKVALAVVVIIAAKWIAHAAGWEPLHINPLFTSLVASTVFLLGFLLNGVLSDFKESEKLPGELATSLEVLTLEVLAVPAYNPDASPAGSARAIAELAESITAWLLLKLTVADLLARYHACHARVVEVATDLPDSTLKGRLMGEMATILRVINRIETIRETSFVPLVYWLAYAGTGLLTVGLVLMQEPSLPEQVFFIAVISFLLIFLIRLIGDIDNPFGYADPDSAEDISFDVLVNTIGRLRALSPGSGR
ncbi:MAG: hypothetical protein ACKO0M_08365 [Cyanobium sp.]